MVTELVTKLNRVLKRTLYSHTITYEVLGIICQKKKHAPAVGGINARYHAYKVKERF